MIKKIKYRFTEERKNKDLTALAQTLQPFMKETARQFGLAEFSILSNWKNIVGETLYSYTKPQKLSFKKGMDTNGVLCVAVSNGAFAVELQYKEKNIVEMINTYLGYCVVASLKFVQNMDFEPNKEYPSEKVKKMLVTKQEENYINSISEGVENENLRKALIQLGVSVFNENKEKQ